MTGLGLGQAIMSPVSDIHGRKPVLIWSLILFTAAAVANVFTTALVYAAMALLILLLARLSRRIPADLDLPDSGDNDSAKPQQQA